MDLALAVFNVGAGLGLLAVGVALAYLSWRVTPLIRETRELARDARRLSRLVEQEVRPLVARASETAAGAEQLVDDAAIKVARLAEAVAALERAPSAGGLPTEPHPAVGRSVESAHTSEDWSNQ